MKTIARKILLAAITVLALTSPALATHPCIHWEDDVLTLNGTIVATDKSTMIASDTPVCGFGSLIITGSTDPRIENITRKWLGKRVVVEGDFEEVGDHGTRLFIVMLIKDED